MSHENAIILFVMVPLVLLAIVAIGGGLLVNRFLRAACAPDVEAWRDSIATTPEDYKAEIEYCRSCNGPKLAGKLCWTCQNERDARAILGIDEDGELIITNETSRSAIQS